MTPDQLRQATAPWRRARQLEILLRNDRDNAIIAALRSGMTEREAARAVGVSHGLPAAIKRRGI